jgi:hypothetical protein
MAILGMGYKIARQWIQLAIGTKDSYSIASHVHSFVATFIGASVFDDTLAISKGQFCTLRLFPSLRSPSEVDCNGLADAAASRAAFIAAILSSIFAE